MLSQDSVLRCFLIAGPMVLRAARLIGVGELVDIVVGSGHVERVGHHPLAYGSDGREVHLQGRLVIPGWVNAHTHLDKALLLSTATPDVRMVGGILVGPMAAEKSRFTVSAVKQRASQVLEWAIETGTTSLRTHVDIDPFAGLTGLKAILELRQEYAKDIDVQVVAFPQEGLFRSPEATQLMEQSCQLGVDVVGGKPGADADFRRHIDHVLNLAARYGLPVDLHLDIDMAESLNHDRKVLDGREYPAEMEAVYLARRVLELPFQGSVTASHLMALDTLEPQLAANVIALLRLASISVIACPSTSLYMQGRDDPKDVRRGITRVRQLVQSGVPTAYASDNVGDAFNVYGSPDMLLNALLTALVCHMRTLEDLELVLDMGTLIPARIMGLVGYGLSEGAIADLVVLDAESLHDAFTRLRPPFLAMKSGHITAGTWRKRRPTVDAAG